MPSWPVVCVLLALALAACRTTYQPEVRRGPGVAPANPTVVLFPIPCRSSDDKCKPEYAGAITAKVRSELEFAGFTIVDGQNLVADPRYRDQREAAVTTDGEPVVEATSLRRVGSTFEDLPPPMQRQLLADARASGVVTGTIQMLGKGTGKNWLVEVTLRLGNDQGQPVWVARCKHESYWNERDSWSIEQAASCALGGALGR
ncbi:MAG: hypothetical protein KBG28_03955 [Kofleriaceae bacterium]|nr:hypothetical protein [Kofleriaceae bacterium]MBP6841052.1 hypothetical protein [Kofleriaceae bacterium]MBP9203093.1 hypothetical protein [Kofleriaceae bacterium]